MFTSMMVKSIQAVLDLQPQLAQFLLLSKVVTSHTQPFGHSCSVTPVVIK